MKRLVVMLALAGAIIAGLGNCVLAQATQAPDPSSSATTAVPSAPVAGQARANRGGMTPEKKAQRLGARQDCRARGKQQSLSHEALRSYVKSCLAAH
jgi:hypothetical protein